MAGNSQVNTGYNSASSTVNSDTQQDAVIVLDERLGIAEAAKLYNRLMMLTSQGDDVILDCSQVTVIDTTVLQMVASFVWQATENGSRVTWGSPSEVFHKSAKLLGLETLMGMESILT